MFLTCFWLFPFLSVQAQADFQIEVKSGYSEAQAGTTDIAAASFEARVYASPVSTQGLPYAEAGFLSQTSYLSYTLTRDETEASGIFPAGPLPFPGMLEGRLEPRTVLKTERDSRIASFRYVQKSSGWFVGSRVGDFSGDDDRGDNLNIDGTVVELSGGRYLTRSTMIHLVARRESESASRTFGNSCVANFFCSSTTGSRRSRNETESWGLGVRHVGRLWNRHVAVEARVERAETELALTTRFDFEEPDSSLPPLLRPEPRPLFRGAISIDDIWQSGLGLTWYANASMGITARYDLREIDSQRQETYVLSGGWFVTPQLEVAIGALRVEQDFVSDELDQYSISIRGRI